MKVKQKNIVILQSFQKTATVLALLLLGMDGLKIIRGSGMVIEEI